MAIQGKRYWVSVVLVLVISGGAWGQTMWYVDDDGAGDPGPGDPLDSDPLEDGSAGHPFDAIQEGIDAEMHMPLLLEIDKGGFCYSLKYFFYEKINQVFADHEFRFDFIGAVPVWNPDSLREGYHTRFLRVTDGSSGPINISWGERGDKGAWASGGTIW